MSYRSGQTVRVSAEFKNLNGDLLDPTKVVLIITNSQFATDYSPEVIRDSLGKYHFDLLLDEPDGHYVYHWEGHSADFEAVGEQSFYVIFD